MSQKAKQAIADSAESTRDMVGDSSRKTKKKAVDSITNYLNRTSMNDSQEGSGYKLTTGQEVFTRDDPPKRMRGSNVRMYPQAIGLDQNSVDMQKERRKQVLAEARKMAKKDLMKRNQELENMIAMQQKGSGGRVIGEQFMGRGLRYV